MRIRNPWLRMVIHTVSVVALLAAAVFVSDRLPYPTDVEAPFYTAGAVGETVSTPTVTLHVTGATVSDKLNLVGGSLKANGHWIVVEATVTARRGPGEARAILVINGRTYTPDNRSPVGVFPISLNQLAAGVPQRGGWIFEVPDDALKATTAELRAWVSASPVIPRFFPRIPSISVLLDATHTPRVPAITPPKAVIAAS